jgi:hypothetical protein
MLRRKYAADPQVGDVALRQSAESKSPAVVFPQPGSGLTILRYGENSNRSTTWVCIDQIGRIALRYTGITRNREINAASLIASSPPPVGAVVVFSLGGNNFISGPFSSGVLGFNLAMIYRALLHCLPFGFGFFHNFVCVCGGLVNPLPFSV